MCAAGSAEDTEYLAVGPHPDRHITSVIGQKVQGPAMLQLWSVPHSIASPGSSDKQLPTLEVGICHQGGLTWDCKWCPSDASTQAPASNVTHSSSLPRHVLTALLIMRICCGCTNL